MAQVAYILMTRISRTSNVHTKCPFDLWKATVRETAGGVAVLHVQLAKSSPFLAIRAVTEF